MPDIGDNLWPAERRLLEAVRSGRPCDLTGGESVSAEQMMSWGSDRTVRGPLLRQLLTDPTAAGLDPASAVIQLRGAVVDSLDLGDATVVAPVSLIGCRIIELDVIGATFAGNAGFQGATFAGNAGFQGATFTGNAGFGGATFTKAARFVGAIASGLRFDRAQFHSPDPGPWVAESVALTAAVLHARSRIEITAGDVSLRRLQAREGAHLIVRAGTAVDLSDAEFLRSSILAAATATPALPEREDPGELPPDSTASAALWKARRDSALAQRLAERFGPDGSARCAEVVSVRRAIVADLVLSGVTLDRCGFAGAHGLDRLRIGATCTFQRAPRWRSRRQVFTEEVALRQTGRRPGGRGWQRLAGPRSDSDGASGPTAAEVASLYRGLRKELEDAKYESAAADFYYGEMEMRRRASRGVERGLLTLYWAVSGYGLRAWRAIAALLVLLAVSAALFTQPGFARIPQPPERITRVDLPTGNVYYAPTPTGRRGGAGADVGRAVEFTARESLTITRGTGAPLLETTGRGTAVDLTLRLFAPLLLGLALLAVRGRTKR